MSSGWRSSVEEELEKEDVEEDRCRDIVLRDFEVEEEEEEEEFAFDGVHRVNTVRPRRPMAAARGRRGSREVLRSGFRAALFPLQAHHGSVTVWSLEPLVCPENYTYTDTHNTKLSFPPFVSLCLSPVSL